MRGQDLDEMIVSIQLKNISLKYALRKVEALTNLPFTYKISDIAAYKDVSCDATDTSGLAAYLARPEVAYDPANAVNQIALQRWVHLYMHGYEAWAEWRRTGYPVLTAAPNNNNIPIPRRQA